MGVGCWVLGVGGWGLGVGGVRCWCVVLVLCLRVFLLVYVCVCVCVFLCVRAPACWVPSRWWVCVFLGVSGCGERRKGDIFVPACGGCAPRGSRRRSRMRASACVRVRHTCASERACCQHPTIRFHLRIRPRVPRAPANATPQVYVGKATSIFKASAAAAAAASCCCSLQSASIALNVEAASPAGLAVWSVRARVFVIG